MPETKVNNSPHAGLSNAQFSSRLGLMAKAMGMALCLPGASRAAEDRIVPPPPPAHFSLKLPSSQAPTAQSATSVPVEHLSDFKLPSLAESSLQSELKSAARAKDFPDLLFERLLNPDEVSFSLSLQQPNFSTHGRPNYIEHFYGKENPFKAFGDNSVVAPNIDFRYFLNPNGEHPSLLFINLAAAICPIHEGDVRFFGVPFKYRMHNSTERIGIGYQIYAFPKDSAFNVSAGARLDAYWGKMTIKAAEKGIPFLVENFHDDGPGVGAAVGLSIEQKISSERSKFLGHDAWLFFKAEYTQAGIARYAHLDGGAFFVGLRVDLSNR